MLIAQKAEVIKNHRISVVIGLICSRDVREMVEFWLQSLCSHTTRAAEKSGLLAVRRGYTHQSDYLVCLHAELLFVRLAIYS